MQKTYMYGKFGEILPPLDYDPEEYLDEETVELEANPVRQGFFKRIWEVICGKGS